MKQLKRLATQKSLIESYLISLCVSLLLVFIVYNKIEKCWFFIGKYPTSILDNENIVT